MTRALQPGHLGVTTTEAITMFFSQIRLRKGLPFPVEMPNDTTRRIFEATDNGDELHAYSTVDEMFKTLDKCSNSKPQAISVNKIRNGSYSRRFAGKKAINAKPK